LALAITSAGLGARTHQKAEPVRSWKTPCRDKKATEAWLLIVLAAACMDDYQRDWLSRAIYIFTAMLFEGSMISCIEWKERDGHHSLDTTELSACESIKQHVPKSTARGAG
jgi:hypothetical protein